MLGALSVAGVLLPWAAAPAAGTAFALLVALRTSARRRRRLTTTVVPVAHVAVVAHPADDAVADAVEDDVEAPVREELFDEAEHAAREEQARIRRLAEEALRAADVPYREPEPGEWTPVAVPLPAYLLKPHARPAVAARAGAARRSAAPPRRGRGRHPALRPALAPRRRRLTPRCPPYPHRTAAAVWEARARRCGGRASTRGSGFEAGRGPVLAWLPLLRGAEGLWRSW